jgi:hypothetical protein
MTRSSRPDSYTVLGWFGHPIFKGDIMRRNEWQLYNVIYGSIAAVIFFVIDVATGGKVVAAVGQAVIIGIVAVAISFKISHTIVARRHTHS